MQKVWFDRTYVLVIASIVLMQFSCTVLVYIWAMKGFFFLIYDWSVYGTRCVNYSCALS
jgi:hypothetical protein